MNTSTRNVELMAQCNPSGFRARSWRMDILPLAKYLFRARRVGNSRLLNGPNSDEPKLWSALPSFSAPISAGAFSLRILHSSGFVLIVVQNSRGVLVRPRNSSKPVDRNSQRRDRIRHGDPDAEEKPPKKKESGAAEAKEACVSTCQKRQGRLYPSPCLNVLRRGT